MGAAAALSGLLFVAVSIGITGPLAWGWTVRSQWRAYQNLEARRWLAMRVVITQTATLPFVVAGGLVARGNASGLYWTVAGVLASFAAGMQNAWVLLIEILR